MMLISITVLVISFFDIKPMWKKKQKKEIAVFLFAAIITLAYGYYYLLNTHTASLIRNIFDLVGIKY